ncbi:GNAT family N-acetyltransferase [Streptomyces alkaliphilus]|uniref:GNAT family N-acetyltransferase n=1 Tax=Streptomyces alkaliphilus TaxID=1472722 RepID=UPI001297D752
MPEDPFTTPVAPRPRAVPAGLTIAPAGPEDLPAARALHERCSAETLARRYHGPVGEADRYLAHLLSPRHGHSFAARTTEGAVVALGHLLWDGEDTEVALLVEDAWQRRGVGSAVLGELLAGARAMNRPGVYAVTRVSDTGMAATMRSTGLPLEFARDGGTVVIGATLAPPVAPPVLSGPVTGSR